MKRMKKIIALMMVLTIAFLLASCNSTPVPDNAENDSDENTSLSDTTATELSDKTEKNETGVNLDGSIISWANMKMDTPDLNLEEEQLQVIKYFDNDYIWVTKYNNLQKYPAIYRNAQIYFNARVVKILDTNDESYECLVAMDGIGMPEEEQRDYGYEQLKELLVVSGKHPEDGRIIEGDQLYFYGRYNDVKSYSIDGKDNFYPSISVNYTVEGVYDYVAPRFSLNDISRVAKAVFGNDIKIKEAVVDVDYELDKIHTPQDLLYIVTPDNQTNANFSQFEFFATWSLIRCADSTENLERNFLVASDFQHYIITVHDHNSNLMYLEYYDRDFKKLWSREFENVDNAVLDYTAKEVYLAADNDLYVINTKDGEDKIPPVMVGEKVKINVVSDGIILIGTGNKDNIMKLDFDGKLVWKTSVDLEVTDCLQIQIINGNVVAEISHEEYSDIGYDGSYVSSFVKKIVAVDKDGNVISEFTDLEY